MDERTIQTDATMTIGRYMAARFTTLKPPMDKVINPITALRMLTASQWACFLCAWSAWTMESLDFFCVSLLVPELAVEFNQSSSKITWGITLVLMFRSAGAVIFGVWSDRFGRKWPFVTNCGLFIVLELATGFCNTYAEFLACRALFGVAMGGLYGNAVASALEDVPDEARGVLSGFFQAGYPVGYLLTTAFARALVSTTTSGWRSLFWFSAGPPVLLIIWRLWLPETQTFRQREMVSPRGGGFTRDLVSAKDHWLMLIYMVLLMAGFNYMAHGSQDFYPTMLIDQFGFSDNAMTITEVVANIGAASGGICIGYLSEIFGRRLTIMVSCVCAGALLYPYTFVTGLQVAAVAFFVQFFVQGAFGVIPTHLMELSPPGIRTLVVGAAYQLGNLASSPAATIQSSVGERYFPLASTTAGVKRYNYALVICVFLGACVAFVIIVTFLGPEKKGRQFGLTEVDMEAQNQMDEKSIAEHLD
ncbi:sugar transporter family protein [Penicillium lagena]|uniref:sugar transporter family protein n=1 Tax=Penicillium lagena TaxID=94218 RepID=UPI002540D861|nr:sugar transporter family protein [Penicillium lagena]KAJ5613345.1 sugar transporter family protein [Penicillium lagena]